MPISHAAQIQPIARKKELRGLRVDGNELLLDMTSPLPVFNEPELRQWALGRRIFISSTMRDLQEERQQAAGTIRSLGATARFFEEFSSPSGPQGIYVPEVARADAVILILGERYGEPVPADAHARSATQIEYDEAVGTYKPVLVYRKEGTQLKREPRLASFMNQLDAKHTVARFHSLGELDALVREGLSSLAQSESLEWCKLGRAVFPVSRWSRRGSSVEIRTTTREPRIVSYLNPPDGRYGQRPYLILGDRVDAVGQLSVHEEASGKYQREYVLDVQLRDESPTLSTMATVVYGNRPPSDWIRAHIKSLLFNEPMPEGYNPYGPGRKSRPDFRLPEIYEALKDRGRVDELFPSLACVYLLDRLLRGSSQEPAVTREIHRLEVSPVYRGRSRVRVEYAIPGQFGQSSIGDDAVEGEMVMEVRHERPLRDWT